jgi:predicted DNA-binding transcriptional regulator AlpA
MARQTALPDTLSPRLIGREASADFLGVSPSKFDQLVQDGRMPRPKRIDGRVLWDVRALNLKIDELPDDPSVRAAREVVL